MSFAKVERQRLATTLLEVGPNADTLCDGWTASHLAAHLWLRERKALAMAGMFLPFLAPITRREMDIQRARPFADVVAEWGSGPRGLWKAIDDKANTLEHFVHHEDVRRARGEQPRSFSTTEASELYRALSAATWLFWPTRARVELRPEGFHPIIAGRRRSPERIQITGAVGELPLYSYGRPAYGLDIVGDEGLVRRMSI